MDNLFKLQWQNFDLKAGIKVSSGLVIMLLLTQVTGESWLATTLAAMCAWLANVPGPLLNRIGGMLVFGVGAIAFTLLSGLIGLDVWPNVIAITLVGLLCTLGLAGGLRSFMVGWSLICWAIYGPFLVTSTSTANCVAAITAGTAIVILLNIIGEWIWGKNDPMPHATDESDDSAPTMPFNQVAAYAVTVALILGFTTYYGWVELKTDPTMMAGGAFFVLGFDPYKTWAAGISRVLGLVAGVALGLGLAELLGPGLFSDIIMVAACGLSFAAFAVHPGAWMFFFMVFIAMGWPELESSVYELIIVERFYGELAGVVAAMIGISFLLWWQNSRSRRDRRRLRA